MGFKLLHFHDDDDYSDCTSSELWLHIESSHTGLYLVIQLAYETTQLTTSNSTLHTEGDGDDPACYVLSLSNKHIATEGNVS
jgi:hypothetical protein